ncbi:MAG: MBL fold metallo-hydrolase, partial [bacterium]
MNRARFSHIILLSFVLYSTVSYPHTGPLPEGNTAPVNHYWDDIDGFFNHQAKVTLELVKMALVRFPPTLPEPFEHRMALLMMDGVLHDLTAPERLAVQEFFHSRMRQALKELTGTQVEMGAMIWKLYNHGFIVRTPTVSIAFDLVRGYSAGAEGFPIPDTLLEQIVHHCDVLFISHHHGDHADEHVAQAFIDLGKPVVAPHEVWAGKPIHEEITHLKRDASKAQELSVRNGEQTLRIVLYPGHQGKSIDNNVPIVFTPEGMSFSQTGDQSNIEDFAWIDKVSQDYS